MSFINLIFKLAAFALKCFVAMLMFNWFIPPAFNVPVVGYVTTLGIMLLIRFINFQSAWDKVEEITDKATTDEGYHIKSSLISLFLSSSVLLLAFLVKSML